MDFTLPPAYEAIRLRARAFVTEHVLPLEADPASYDAHENIRLDLLETLRAKAREAFSAFPKAAYMTEIEWWRELGDGRIEFTIQCEAEVTP